MKAKKRRRNQVWEINEEYRGYTSTTTLNKVSPGWTCQPHWTRYIIDWERSKIVYKEQWRRRKWSWGLENCWPWVERRQWQCVNCFSRKQKIVSVTHLMQYSWEQKRDCSLSNVFGNTPASVHSTSYALGFESRIPSWTQFTWVEHEKFTQRGFYDISINDYQIMENYNFVKSYQHNQVWRHLVSRLHHFHIPKIAKNPCTAYYRSHTLLDRILLRRIVSNSWFH